MIQFLKAMFCLCFFHRGLLCCLLNFPLSSGIIFINDEEINGRQAKNIERMLYYLLICIGCQQPFSLYVCGFFFLISLKEMKMELIISSPVIKNKSLILSPQMRNLSISIHLLLENMTYWHFIKISHLTFHIILLM